MRVVVVVMLVLLAARLLPEGQQQEEEQHLCGVGLCHVVCNLQLTQDSIWRILLSSSPPSFDRNEWSIS